MPDPKYKGNQVPAGSSSQNQAHGTGTPKRPPRRKDYGTGAPFTEVEGPFNEPSSMVPLGTGTRRGGNSY